MISPSSKIQNPYYKTSKTHQTPPFPRNAIFIILLIFILEGTAGHLYIFTIIRKLNSIASLEHLTQLATEHHGQFDRRDEYGVQYSSWLEEDPKGQILQEITEAAAEVFVD